MGYHAPSADEFYRYALRLDGHPRLSDRFGFSIVLVNDSSSLCRDFLTNFCIDLCQRTAGRVRFVFFSELPEGRVQAIADELNSGRRKANGGLLSNILNLIGRRSRYDFEREPWESLRPSALRPLRRHEDIEAHLSWQAMSLTAMPGVGEAMRFAQRLGIGRHVPCILTITEIGERHVHLLPMAGRSAAEIFHRVRGWIDDFYEHNRVAIDRWELVENEVEGVARAADVTLSEIRSWRYRQVSAWGNLALVAAAIEVVESGDRERWRALAKRLAGDSAATFRLQEAVRSLIHLSDEIDRRRASLIERAVQAVGAAATAQLGGRRVPR